MTNKKNSEPTPAAPIKAKQQFLNELKLSWAGKLFFAGAAAYLGAKIAKGVQQGLREEDVDGVEAPAEQPPPSLPLKIRGTPEQIQALKDALSTSKEFQDEIGEQGATIEDVIEKLKEKNLSRARFKEITGKEWPL